MDLSLSFSTWSVLVNVLSTLEARSSSCEAQCFTHTLPFFGHVGGWVHIHVHVYIYSSYLTQDGNPYFLNFWLSHYHFDHRFCLFQHNVIQAMKVYDCVFRCHSVTKLCLTLCDPMNCSTPGFPVLHYLSEFAQTLVHWASDAIQPSHPLSPASPLALNLSQHQGLFQWVDSLHQVTKILELLLRHQSFQWIVRVDFLWDWLVWSPCSPRDSRESSPAPQFETINSLALSLLYGPALTSVHEYWKNHSFNSVDFCRQRCLCFLIC